MALNKIELIDVIKRHNDPNDATTIVSIQGTSVSNFFPERMRKGDIISIDNDDIVWKEYADDSDTPLIYRTGLDNIDMVKFIPAPGSYTVKDNGRVESTNTRTTVESPDGTVLRMVPGPQGDKGERGEPGPRGERGPKPEITINPVNNNWIVDGVDTNVNAVGPKGDKVEITINSANKHWVIDSVDTNIVAEGKDGKTPTVEIDNATKRWKINGVDTNIVAEGTKGDKGDKTVVTIDPVTKHWMIDGSDTNIVAEGTKGEKGEAARIHIDPDNKHFIINGNDSGVRAEGIKGEDGVTPDIKINEVSKHWFINGVDTQIKAEGIKGEKGDKTLVTIDSANKHWLIDGVDTGVVAEGTRGTDGTNGKSAYEIALETGYVGSKEDWVTSLKGVDGAKGSAGQDGNALNMNIALLGTYRNNDATGIKAISVKPTLNDTEIDKEEVKEHVKITAKFRGFNLRNSNENDEWKNIPNLSMDYDGDEIYVKGLPFTDGVRKGDPLEIIFSFTYKDVTTHCYRRLDNINDGIGSVNLDNYIRREDLPTTLDTSHLIGRTEVEQNYAKKTDIPTIPSLEGYAKTTDVANTYATKQSVEEVKDNLEIEKSKISEISGKVTSLEANNILLATKKDVDDTYAKKTDIPVVPSLEGYARIDKVEEVYAKKSEISSLADLSNKVDSSELANYYTKGETVSKGEYETLKNTVDANTGEITKLATKAEKLDTIDSTYAKKSELPNVTGLISEATADGKYAKIVDVESTYAKKTDIPTVPSLEGYAINSVVDSTYAKKSEIPNVTGFITEVNADNKYAMKTDIPSLEGYAKKSEIPTVHSLEGYAKVSEVDSTYAKKSELPSITGLISEATADGKYAKKSDIPSLDGYAKTTDIPSVTGFITEGNADSKYVKTVDAESTYAKKSELPSTAGFITEVTADNKYAKAVDVESTYAKKTDIPTVHSLEGYAKTTDIESTYAKKTELPNISGLISETTADGKYAKVTDIPSLEGYAKKSELPSTTGFITEVNADSRYVKVADAESTYAKKSEIPSTAGFITEVNADDKYAKKTDIPSIAGLLNQTSADDRYLKKTDAPNIDLSGYLRKDDFKSNRRPFYLSEEKTASDVVSDATNRGSDISKVSEFKGQVISDNLNSYVMGEYGHFVEYRAAMHTLATALPSNYNIDDFELSPSDRVKLLTNKNYSEFISGITSYNDAPLINRVIALERKTSSFTPYDDSDIRRSILDINGKIPSGIENIGTRVNTLESDRTDLKDRVRVLENKPSGTGSYDDTALSNRVKALEGAGREIYGTGYPERAVEALPGTIYVDKAMTNGAYKWIKVRGGSGNTGWEVLLADTGWIKLNIVSGLGNSYVRIRRINNQVFYQFGGLSWGWFGIIRRGAPGFVNQPSDRERNVFILQLGKVPVGFRCETSQIGNIYNDKGTIYGTWYLGGQGDSNQLRFQFTDPIPTDRDIGDIRVSQISYPTSEPYPATLKIT